MVGYVVIMWPHITIIYFVLTHLDLVQLCGFDKFIRLLWFMIHHVFWVEKAFIAISTVVMRVLFLLMFSFLKICCEGIEKKWKEGEQKLLKEDIHKTTMESQNMVLILMLLNMPPTISMLSTPKNMWSMKASTTNPLQASWSVFVPSKIWSPTPKSPKTIKMSDRQFELFQLWNFDKPSLPSHNNSPQLCLNDPTSKVTKLQLPSRSTKKTQNKPNTSKTSNTHSLVEWTSSNNTHKIHNSSPSNWQ